MNLYKICSFSPTIFHLHLHLYTDLNTSVFWKWVGRSVCIHLISKKVIYTPQAATMKSHEGSVFGAWVASDILFLSLCWTPLMQRKSEKSVKILAARQSKMTFFLLCLLSLCGKHSKSQVPAPGPCLERDVCHGASLIRLCKEPMLDMVQECTGGCLITAVVSSMVFFIVPSRFAKKKRVFFIQASLPFKSFIGFLTTYISRSGSLYWLEGLSVTLQTATLSASCACSQLCHNDCILDPSMSDLFLPSLTCL